MKLKLPSGKFGRLIIIAEAPKNREQRTMWCCVCDCGAQVIVSGRDLRNGHTKSCGCLQKENAGLFKRKPGVSVRQRFLKYRFSAKKRKLSFTLSFEQFTEICRRPCFYCGSAPSNVHFGRYETFVYSGIDRMDNTIGYEYHNSVPCCGLCNFMKQSLSVGDFFQHVQRIYGTMAAKAGLLVQESA